MKIEILEAVAEADAREWDSLAGTDNPFVAHDFLRALEDSGSATAGSGWLPRHLVVRDPAGKMTACAPLYVKGHSHGEYVFDWGWAEAYQRAGGNYYPKLQCAVPFTPVTGPRLMGDGPLLARAMVEVARQWGLSSVHVTFPLAAEMPALEAAGFLPRMGLQFHWTNHGYGSFDDFLSDLSSRKRKQIRKEREAASRQGLAISTLVGGEVKARHWDAFHRFHSLVVDRKWGSPYLTREFFDRLSASPLGERVVLVWVEEDGRPLAAAFNMLGTDTLFGRTWGARREAPFLHFEACYYRALDFAIAHGLARVEAGAQGEHKVSRGYLPVPTWSAHWIADPALRGPVARFLAAERPAVAQGIAELAASGPFRRDRHSSPAPTS